MRAVLVSLFSLACGATPSSPTPSSPTEPDPSRLSHPLDVADGVGTFTSIPWGFETSSYWIEGPNGVVVIDTQFLPSEAERLLAHVERATPKPVVLALVLHPNPDKFNGTDVFRARGIPVMTSAQVLAAVPDVAARRRRAFLARYAPDYPERDPELTSFGEATRTLEVAGLTLKLHVLGPGCSAAHVVVEWNGHLFAGDLIASRTHPWLELGFARDWIARLDELDTLAPRRVHPGRGPSGGRELLASTRAYLTRVLARRPHAIPRFERSAIASWPSTRTTRTRSSSSASPRSGTRSTHADAAPFAGHVRRRSPTSAAPGSLGARIRGVVLLHRGVPPGVEAIDVRATPGCPCFRFHARRSARSNRVRVRALAPRRSSVTCRRCDGSRPL